MDLNQLSGGIPSRISGLVSAVIRHLLALAEIAAEETRFLIRQSIVAILLLLSLIVTVVIGYLALLATVISILSIHQGWGWAASFGAVALVHFFLGGILFTVLLSRSLPNPYKATATEFRKDLDALNNYAKRSPNSSPSSQS